MSESTYEFNEGMELSYQLELRNNSFLKDGKTIANMIDLKGEEFECTILGGLQRVKESGKKGIACIDKIDPIVAFGCYLYLHRKGLIEADANDSAIITKLKCRYSAGIRYVEVGSLGVVMTVTSSESDNNPNNLPMVKLSDRFYFFEKWDPEFDNELMTYLTAIVMTSMM